MSQQEALIQQIRAYLREHQMSQEQFARRIGVSWITLNRWLSGKRQPRSQAIIRVIEEELKKKP